MRSSLTAATIFAALMAAALPASGQDAKPELSRVRLAVGGKPALFYLPLTAISASRVSRSRFRISRAARGRCRR